MQIDKQQIIDYLRNRGDHDKATQAESELPESVDTDKDSGLLSKLGIQPEELLGDHPPGPAGMGTLGGPGPEELLGGHPPGPAGMGTPGGLGG